MKRFKRHMTNWQRMIPTARFRLVIFSVVFAGLGVSLLLASHAATPAASVEPETGTVATPATKLSDSSASGGSAIKFAGSGTGTVPAQCASGGNYLWSNLETCGWPGPSTTGPIAAQCPGGVLTNVGSNTKTITNINTAGTSISCENITGCLAINAQNVTVTNVKLTCNSGKTGDDANGTSVIAVNDGASATISHVEMNGLDGNHACIWHEGTAMSATAVNCYGIDDGIFSWADTGYSQTTGDHFTIKDSYFHDFTTKTANGHIDGYQTEGAGNGLIDHNTYLMTSDDDNSSDSAIAIWDGNKSSHDITVQNNLITGGGFAMYAEDYSPSEQSPAGGSSVTNIIFNNNSFSTHLFHCVGYYGVWYYRGIPTDGWHRSGNKILENGFNLDNQDQPGCN